MQCAEPALLRNYSCFLGYPSTHEMLFHVIQRAARNKNSILNPEFNRYVSVYEGRRRKTKLKSKEGSSMEGKTWQWERRIRCWESD
jgi:hypothetical protein